MRNEDVIRGLDFYLLFGESCESMYSVFYVNDNNSTTMSIYFIEVLINQFKLLTG